MTTDPEPETVQRLVGYVAALAFMVIAYQSMSPDLTLSWPVIVGTIVIIAMLLGRLDRLALLVAKWKGTKHRIDPDRLDRGEDNDDD